MRLGSLFDGIGGFPYSASKFGIEPVWASEIEPWPIQVTTKHFPNMEHLGDVTKINGAEVEPVDIITFGSPCTRLSVAGRHDGFDVSFRCVGDKENPHSIYKNKIRATDKYTYFYTDTCKVCGKELVETNESALFFHAIRIIKEMRGATNGIYPRFAIWENVPGAFSSNRGQDFRTVLESFAENKIPMPVSGGWANAGMVRTERVDIAWRVLDAQYWGVPQRRRRVFLVTDFTGRCAAEILFKPESLSRYSSQSQKAGKDPAENVKDSITTAGGSRVTSTVTATYSTKWNGNSGANTGDHFVSVKKELMPKKMREDGSSKVIDISVSQCLTSRTGCRYDPETETLIPVLADQGGSVMSVHNDISPTLRAEEHGHQPIVMREVSRTLRAEAGAPKHKADWESLIIEPRSQDGVCRIHEGVVPTLNTAQDGQRQPCVLAFAQNQRDEVRDLGNKSGALQAQPGMKQQTYVCSKSPNNPIENKENPDSNEITTICPTYSIQGSMIGRADKNGPVGDGINKEVSFTLNTIDRHAVVQPIPINTMTAQGRPSDKGRMGSGIGKSGDPANTISAAHSHAVATTKGVGNIGSTTEGNAREILRKLWGEIGTEAFAEWGFGVLNILQPEEVLQSGLYGRTLGQNREAQEESQQTCKAKQGDSTEDEREGAKNNTMREMRGIIQKIRCTPQGQGRIQQFTRELNDIMQELPQFNSPAKGEVPDMWRSGQGTRLLQQALSSLQEIRRPLLHQVQYAVRRLTPTEALRLQGFPDWWLDIEGMSDTAKYQAIGNSLAIPCVDYIMRNLASLPNFR